jgi:hypothetical protein
MYLVSSLMAMNVSVEAITGFDWWKVWKFKRKLKLSNDQMLCIEYKALRLKESCSSCSNGSKVKNTNR